MPLRLSHFVQGAHVAPLPGRWTKCANRISMVLSIKNKTTQNIMKPPLALITRPPIRTLKPHRLILTAVVFAAVISFVSAPARAQTNLIGKNSAITPDPVGVKILWAATPSHSYLI